MIKMETVVIAVILFSGGIIMGVDVERAKNKSKVRYLKPANSFKTVEIAVSSASVVSFDCTGLQQCKCDCIAIK